MGIYDRDYYRQPRRSGFSSHLPRTVVGTLIAINVAVWIVDQFTVTADGRYLLSNLFAASPATLTHPWMWWQFLTAGFTHALRTSDPASGTSPATCSCCSCSGGRWKIVMVRGSSCGFIW